MEKNKLFATCAIWVVGSMTCALLVAGFEALWCGVRGSDALASFGLLASLYLLLGFFGGLISGLWVHGWLNWVGSPRVWLRKLSTDPSLDVLISSILLTALVGIVVQVVGVYLFASKMAVAMANKQLGYVSTALVSAAIVAIVVISAGPIAAFWRSLLCRFHIFNKKNPSTWLSLTAFVVCALLLLVVGAGVLVLRRIDWRVLQFGPWIVLGVYVVGTVVLATLFSRRLTQVTQVTHVTVAKIWAVLFSLCGVSGVGVTLFASSRSSVDAILVVQQHGFAAPAAISVARRFKDADGDTFSPWFGGGDCDDHNRVIHPGARDTIGNGIDENCEGGDAKSLHRHARHTHAVSKPRIDGLVLICIDTLRADRIGARMSDGTSLTPALDQLARRSTVFERAYAQAANTPQSFPSAFTSLYPSRVPYAETFVGYPKLKPQAVTLFELLQRAGVKTHAVTSHFYFTHERGITQGVDVWDNEGATTLKDSNRDIAAPRIVPKAITQLKRLTGNAAPFVLFVHLFEPHSTYVTHSSMPPITERGTAGLKQKYDYEVKYVDGWVGQLTAAIQSLGGDRKIGTIIFSDHGEAFGEHQFYFHGQALYDEVLRVPLIVSLPAIANKPRQITSHVGLIDLAPTVLELFGVAAPSHFQGDSLVPYIDGGAVLDRPIGAVLMPYPAWPKGQFAVIEQGYKVIFRTTENRSEIYDLKADPKELNNLVLSDPQKAETWRKRANAFVESELQ